jgi:carboxypeptidase C (cathepsin A)
MWAGDADWICNWMGNQAAAGAVSYPRSSLFKSAAMKPYTVGGTQTGMFKTQGNLSFLRVFGAGHEVPSDRKRECVFVYSITNPKIEPATALQVFKQTMQKEVFSST